MDRFTKAAPSTLASPHFPSQHAAEDLKKSRKGQPDTEEAGTPEKLTFNFYLPHAVLGTSQKVLAIINSHEEVPCLGCPAPPPRQAAAMYYTQFLNGPACP